MPHRLTRSAHSAFVTIATSCGHGGIVGGESAVTMALVGRLLPDRTTLDLALADTVEKEATITRVAAKNIMLPPGQPLAPATGQLKIPALAGDLTIWGVAPHMHTRGKTLEVTLDSGGTKSCITRVQDWNFHWQGFATYAKPVAMKGGDMLTIDCAYDTTKETTTVTSGESTADEMCINFLYVTK